MKKNFLKFVELTLTTALLVASITTSCNIKNMPVFSNKVPPIVGQNSTFDNMKSFLQSQIINDCKNKSIKLENFTIDNFICNDRGLMEIFSSCTINGKKDSEMVSKFYLNDYVDFDNKYFYSANIFYDNELVIDLTNSQPIEFSHYNCKDSLEEALN